MWSLKVYNVYGIDAMPFTDRRKIHSWTFGKKQLIDSLGNIYSSLHLLYTTYTVHITYIRTTRAHNSFADRSFGAAGPRIWNSLPCGLRTLDISYL